MATNQANDDSGNTGINSRSESFRAPESQQDLGTGVGAPGTRLYNPLSQFTSHNYQLSLYLATPEAINQYHEFGRRGLDTSQSSGFYLVAQTGGKNIEVAPGLELDVYLDNLTIKQATAGGATGSIYGTQNINFDIIEPHSLSFLKRLKISTNGNILIAKYKREIELS
jgi:hypothetical protein